MYSSGRGFVMGNDSVTEILGGYGQKSSAVKYVLARVNGKLQLAKCGSKVLRQLKCNNSMFGYSKTTYAKQL